MADPLDFRHLPSFEALDAEMHHRPIGRIIGDICADLGVSPALCLSSFWDAVLMAELRYRGSPGTYHLRLWRRENSFEDEQDRWQTMDCTWPGLVIGAGREQIRQALGFLIGEEPVEPPHILAAHAAPPTPDATAPPPAPDAHAPAPPVAPPPPGQSAAAPPRAPATPATGPP